METCEYHNQLVSDVGEIKGGIKLITDSINRLDSRINGSFKQIGDHIAEAPEYRSKIVAIETEVKNIKEEKNNSVKASQWRIGLIVGIGTSVVMILIRVLFRV